MTPIVYTAISLTAAAGSWALVVYVRRLRRQIEATAREIFTAAPVARWARTHALVIPPIGDEKGVNIRLDVLRWGTDHNRQHRPSYILPAGVRIEYRGEPPEELPEPADKPLNRPLT